MLRQEQQYIDFGYTNCIVFRAQFQQNMNHQDILYMLLMMLRPLFYLCYYLT